MRIKLDIQHFAEAGTLVINTEIDNAGVEKGLKKIEYIIENYGKKDKVIFNTASSNDIDEIEKNLNDINDRYKEILKENQDIEDITGEISKFIREARENGVDPTTESYIKQLDTLYKKQELSMAHYRTLIDIKNQNAKILQQEEDQYRYAKERIDALGREQGVDTSYISSAIGGENSSGDEGANAKASLMSAVLGKLQDFGKGLLKTVGSVLKTVLKIAGAVAGITIGASFIATVVSAFVKAIINELQKNETLVANIKYIWFVITKIVDNLATALSGKVTSAMQGLVNLAYTLVVAFGKLLSWLFKTDLLAGTTKKDFEEWQKQTNDASKNLASGAASAKEIKKQLAGFDEMNVLQEPAGSGGSGGGGGRNNTLPDLKEAQQMQIPKWLQWIIDNADIISGVVGMIAGALVALKLGLSPLLGMGIGLILAGVVNLIIDIIDFIKDPTWENFKTLIDDFLIDLGMIIAGISILVGGWLPALIGLVMVIVGIIIRYWDEIKEALGKAWGWFKEKVVDPVVNLFKSAWETIKQVFAPFIEFFSSLFGTAWENIKVWIYNIKAIMTWIGGIMKDIFLSVWNKIKEIFAPVINFFKEQFQKAFEAIKKVFGPIIQWVSNLWNQIKTTLVNIFIKIGEVLGGAFKGVVNAIIGAIETALNFPHKALNKLIDKINTIPGVNLKKFSTYSLPRLAKGGIINQPGRGVAIGGESGREGILPLTDDGAMKLLGQEIGKWITINASITNTMNGRVISRELQKINDESSFAFNR